MRRAEVQDELLETGLERIRMRDDVAAGRLVEEDGHSDLVLIGDLVRIGVGQVDHLHAARRPCGEGLAQHGGRAALKIAVAANQ